MKNMVLSNGVQIPEIGFGTWRTPDGNVCVESVKEAIRIGHRHIDGAALYGNEVSVGDAVRACGVDRKDLFITSKLWNDQHTYDDAIRACNKTLSDLGVDYIDLYLIHWPNPVSCRERWQERNADVWRAFETLYREGKVRSIGVSNFLEHHLDELAKTATIAPMVNQIEINPGFARTDLVEYCKARNIVVEAWSPLANGNVLKLECLQALSAKYGRSIPQIVLRWLLQRDVLPLTKSVTPSRIVENFSVFDFELSAEDMDAINNIPIDVSSGSHPDTANF